MRACDVWTSVNFSRFLDFRSPEEREEWCSALDKTIAEHKQKQSSFSPKFVPQSAQAEPLELGKQVRLKAFRIAFGFLRYYLFLELYMSSLRMNANDGVEIHGILCSVAGPNMGTRWSSYHVSSMHGRIYFFVPKTSLQGVRESKCINICIRLIFACSCWCATLRDFKIFMIAVIYQQVVCANCSDNKAPLQYMRFRPDRVCDDCYQYLLKGI